MQEPKDERERASPKQPIIVRSEQTEYEIVKRIMETASARYYLCQTHEGGWRVLSIAATVADNAAMERIAEILRILEQESADCEAAYQKNNVTKVKFWDFRESVIRRARELRDEKRWTDELPPTPEELEEVERQREKLLNKRLHYDWLFPILQEDFNATTQGKRHTNVLEFIGADISELMPLEHIVKQNQRVDLKTSAWIVGRMLKLLGFVAASKVHVAMSISKFLLGPEKHQLMLLDWSNATEVFGDNLEGVNRNISQIGKCGLALLGVEYDENDWRYPYAYQENEEKERKYLQFLYDMAMLKRQFYRHYKDSYLPHRWFYQVVDDTWEKSCHPFTAYPI